MTAMETRSIYRSSTCSAIPDDIEMARRFGLTRMEGQIFGLIYRRSAVSRDGIMSMLYDHRPVGEYPYPKILDTVFCHMRKKLKPFSIIIDTIHGQGYAMTPVSKARVAELCRTGGIQ